MSIETTHTIPAVLDGDDVELVFAEVDVTPSVTPYARQISMTIGADVYTFDTSDLLEFARRISGG